MTFLFLAAALTWANVVAAARPRRPAPRRAPIAGRWAAFDRRLGVRWSDAGVGPALERPLAVWLLLGGLGAVAGGLVAQAAVPVGAVSAMAAPLIMVLARGDRSDAQLLAVLPEFAESMARRLRAGSSMVGALRDEADGVGPPLATDLHRLARRVEWGRSLDAELDEWPRRRPLIDLRLVVTALTLGHRTGGQRAVALDAVARSLRDKRAVDAELRALTSQVRASALVVGAAPVIVAALLLWSGPGIGSSLGSALVWISMAAGIGLDLVGVVWMRALARPRW